MSKNYFTKFDAYNQEDPGIYYVYEHGKLRSPPGYSQNISPNHKEGCVTKKNYYQWPSTLVTNSNLHNPPKLLDICVTFIASHIEYVESLVGFPDLIGEQLFKSVANCGRLKEVSDESERILQIFSDAYRSLLLENLVLKNCCIQLENCMKLTKSCFGNLTVLNLHGCRVGDEHDVLDFIGNSNCLKCLGLCDNALTDRGLQRMTSPMRVLKTGPKELIMLDLACNPLITNEGVRYILSFRQLKSIDLSGTKIKVEGLKKIESSMQLKLVHFKSSLPAPLLDDYNTKGWASDIVHNWLETSAKNKGKETMSSPSRSKDLAFYSKKKKRQNLAENFKEETKSHHITPPRQPILVLKSNTVERTSSCLNKQTNRTNRNMPHYTNSANILKERDKNCFSYTTRDDIILGSNNCSAPDRSVSSSPIFSPDNKKVKSKPQLLTRDSAINILTQACNDEEEQDQLYDNRKRKRNDESDNTGTSPVSKEARRYSVEEQDILGGYLAPSTSPTCTGSLIEAMQSSEWGNSQYSNSKRRLREHKNLFLT